MYPLIVLYILINLVAFILYGIDKRKAIKNQYRISENHLIGIALMGPIGAICAMQIFRHKTQKFKFKVTVPLVAAIHILIVLFAGSIYGEESNPSPWAKSEFEIAVQKGYITEELKTGLQKYITRREFVELIMGSYETIMGEVPDITLEDNVFFDISNLAVVKAEKIGIISGGGEKKFNPDDILNREQMIVILTRMNRAIEIRMNERVLKYQNIGLDFIDVSDISTWAVESFQIGIVNTMIAGVGDNRLGPKDLTTREQAIILNLRLMLRYESNENLVAYAKVTNNEDSKPLMNQKGIVSVAILNMRKSPDLTSSANIIRKLKLSETVELIDKAGEWYHILASDNLEGYVYAEYIVIADTLATTTNTEKVDAVIAYAKTFQGTRYVYGGTSLTNGIDCSGFTMKVMSKFGITLNRSSAGQGLNGIAIEREDLKPGDLILYGFNRSVSHAAIYIGNNQVIHANTTYGVSITPAFGWLNKPFIGIRRVIF